MFTLQVLNDGNEWELIDTLFLTEDKAVEFFNTELADCFDVYEVTEMETE
jgi:hypothetical protein